MSHFAASVKHYKNFRRFICDFDPVNLSVHCVSKKLQSCCFWNNFEGVFIATRLNWTQLTQLNSEQPSQSCFCLWRHDLQTESTGSLRSLIGDSCSRRERVDNSTSSWVELRRRSVYSDAELSWVDTVDSVWGHDVINKNTTDLAVRCSTGSVELSWVQLSSVQFSWVVSL